MNEKKIVNGNKKRNEWQVIKIYNQMKTNKNSKAAKWRNKDDYWKSINLTHWRWVSVRQYIKKRLCVCVRKREAKNLQKQRNSLWKSYIYNHSSSILLANAFWCYFCFSLNDNRDVEDDGWLVRSGDVVWIAGQIF